jgi:formylglycine-generating enzyme required for sulfatase activity
MLTHIRNAALGALAVLALAAPASAQTCQGDIAQDGRVDGGDLGLVLSNWGPVVPTSPISVRCDIDGDGAVTGGDLGVLLADWGFCPASIVSVNPAQGCLLGGTEITVTGTWLGQASTVTVGGIPCTGLTLISATELRATVPAGVAGPAAVEVATPAGTFAAATDFTYLAPLVTGITPSSGLLPGGALVTITGQCLAGTTSVSFGGVLGTGLSIPSASQVQVTSPPGSPGAVDVTVTGPKGAITVPGGFTYQLAAVPSWATLVEAQPDPAVVPDASLRAAIEATGLAWRVRDTATQIELLLIPPGTFRMGCSTSSQWWCGGSESPVHTVILTSAFYLGRYEVTQAQWQSRMGSNPSYHRDASAEVPASQVPSRPVERVSWNMIAGVGGFMAQTGMRLPTEAEWEYAYRAGTTTAFHGFTGYPNGTNDDTLAGSIAWNTHNSNGQTRPVGGKAGNGFGLHDMSGNVREWVNDWYSGSYYSTSPVQDPPGPAGGSSRVSRGGMWESNTGDLRASSKYDFGPDNASGNLGLGFRVARNP